MLSAVNLPGGVQVWYGLSTPHMPLAPSLAYAIQHAHLHVLHVTCSMHLHKLCHVECVHNRCTSSRSTAPAVFPTGQTWTIRVAGVVVRAPAADVVTLLTAKSCVQRRRTAEDELNMREVYTDGDLISVSCMRMNHVMSLNIMDSQHCSLPSERGVGVHKAAQ